MIARTILQRIARNSLVRNTSWQLSAEGGRLLIQSIAFVLISRALGPEGIGAFAGAMALVFLFVPFAGWGSGHLLIMHVARKPSSFAVQWGNALLLILAFGLLLTLLAIGVTAWLVPNLPLGIVLTLCIAEFIFGKLSDVSTQAFRAFERMSGAAQQMMVEGVFRLVATVLYIAITPVPTAQGWAIWYLAATVLEALVGFASVTWRFGLPRPKPALIRSTLSAGGLFSIDLASASIYNNIDKTMLAQLATFGATGIYATAYRIVDIAFIPAKSIVAATYPRFFKVGAAGITGSLAFARRLLPFSLGAGLLITLGLFIIAPLAPLIFGKEYDEAVSAIRWLALIPLFRSLHNIAANTLTGAGHQLARSVVQIGVAVLNVLLNLWLIPRYSWLGAAWASLISDGMLALVLWPLCYFVQRRAGGATTPAAEQGASVPQQNAGPAGSSPAHSSPSTGKQPSISIIINNYNYSAFLREAIESGLRQTYDRTEVIVVDDGSTDNSRAIIASYGDRIIPILKQNGGQASALNAGLARSCGDIVIFLDADDILLPHIGARVAQLFQAQPSIAKIQYRLAVIDSLGRAIGIVKPAKHAPMPSGDLRQCVIRNFDDLPWQSTSGNAFAAWALRRIFPVPEQAYPPPTGADYYVANVVALFGTVLSLEEVGGYYRMHGSNHHHHSEMECERSRDIIRWIGTTHTYIQQYGMSLGLCSSGTAQPSGVRYLAHRMASYKLDPARHSIKSDRLLSLCWKGLQASYCRADLSLALQLMFMAWFVAMLAAPKPLARWLAQKLFFPETRGRFNTLLRICRRAHFYRRQPDDQLASERSEYRTVHGA